MANLASLWIGDSLGLIETASAKSILRNGNTLTIFTYGNISNIPNGVKIDDANKIFPAEVFLKYKNSNSPALHSDLFRYKLIKSRDIIWVDLDVIAFRKFDFNSQHVFGFESGSSINNAILGLPKNSPTLQNLLKYDANHRGIPPFMSGWRKKNIKSKTSSQAD